jgi:hypothetical protein
VTAPTPRRRRLVRDLHSGAQLDLFLVSAVASVLVIRFYLRVTGYPQVGGETLHIAHVLWGGLLMLGAFILLLAFLGRASRRWAALLGGVGFGAFIDEVGKFVTRDNDYFYRPAVAMIYVVLVLAYVAVRFIRRRALSEEEYLINALHELEEAALHDMQREERERALLYLERAGPGHPLTRGLVGLVGELREAPSRSPGRIERIAAGLLRHYRRLTGRPAFWRALVLFFVAQVAMKLLHVAILIWYPEAGSSLPARLAFMSRRIDDYALPEWLQLGSSLLSALLVGAGIAALRGSRQTALRRFQLSILISVFVTQVFMFYRSQWDALVVLGFNLLVLLALGYMRAHEEQEGPAVPPDPGRRSAA